MRASSFACNTLVSANPCLAVRNVTSEASSSVLNALPKIPISPLSRMIALKIMYRMARIERPQKPCDTNASKKSKPFPVKTANTNDQIIVRMGYKE